MATKKAKSAPPRPPIHVLVGGDPGSGKSTFAATFPKPMLVHCFDAHGKDMPYLRVGAATDFEELEDGTLTRSVVDPSTGELLVRVEYFGEADPEHPSSYQRFLAAMHAFNSDERSQWATYVLDSITTMSLAARKLSEYKLNKKAADGRQHYGYATARLEEQLVQRFPNFHTLNVVVLAHYNEEKDELHGTFLRNLVVPGQLRRAIGSQYMECYRAFYQRATKDEDAAYLLQTRAGGGYNAASGMLEAPDPCPQHYDSLWDTYDALHE